jgi:hypothetical protein
MKQPKQPHPFIPEKRFGRLVTISETRVTRTFPSTGPRLHRVWTCQCDCGIIKPVYAAQVYNGNTISCGCYNRDIKRAQKTTHGRSGTSEYSTWEGMLNRCQRTTCFAYDRYGGRGIQVCDRWKVFENFFADMGERPSPKHTLHRIYNDGNYEPSNCRWVTRKEQMADRPRAHRKVYCPQGHRYGLDNLFVTKKGYKLCLICKTERNKKGNKRQLGQPTDQLQVVEDLRESL